MKRDGEQLAIRCASETGGGRRSSRERRTEIEKTERSEAGSRDEWTRQAKSHYLYFSSASLLLPVIMCGWLLLPFSPFRPATDDCLVAFL
ncbi:Hypothetical protein NTJ_00426 [Nesidiocoris tenuis]|uniref:KASH domain-containing protein n=1 Tax=Nesidiocoris tenuis TaxID=355587 RepID=A0ABN7A6B3_9HEMI|nr:Hypothetical protein NTJ_00426 [Nesidiocoris tenuis]